MGVIVAHKPKPGQAQVLRSLFDKLVGVLEWRSAESVAAAHGNPAVLAPWAELAEACDDVPLASLPEANMLFAEFTAVA